MADPKPSVICFKLSGTCFVLFIAVGIGFLVARGIGVDIEHVAGIGTGAIVLLVLTGITLLLGIIAAIWEQ